MVGGCGCHGRLCAHHHPLPLSCGAARRGSSSCSAGGCSPSPVMHGLWMLLGKQWEGMLCSAETSPRDCCLAGRRENTLPEYRTFNKSVSDQINQHFPHRTQAVSFTSGRLSGGAPRSAARGGKKTVGEWEARGFPGTQPCRLGLRLLPGRGCRCCHRHRPARPRPSAAAGRLLPRCPVTPAALRNCWRQRWLWLSLTSGCHGTQRRQPGAGPRLRRMSGPRPAQSRAPAEEPRADPAFPPQCSCPVSGGSARDGGGCAEPPLAASNAPSPALRGAQRALPPALAARCPERESDSHARFARRFSTALCDTSEKIQSEESAFLPFFLFNLFSSAPTAREGEGVPYSVNWVLLTAGQWLPVPSFL